jgi:hypothetical protein
MFAMLLFCPVLPQCSMFLLFCNITGEGLCILQTIERGEAQQLCLSPYMQYK